MVKKVTATIIAFILCFSICSPLGTINARSGKANAVKMLSATLYEKKDKLIIKYKIKRKVSCKEKTFLHIAAPATLWEDSLKTKKGVHKYIINNVSKKIGKWFKDSYYRWCDGYTKYGKKNSSWSTVKVKNR